MNQTTRRVLRDPFFGSTEPIAGIKKAQTAAKNASSTATGDAGKYESAGTDINSTLVPELKQEALHPQGYSPTDKNAMLVGSEETAGGVNSGIVGQANLEAARTHNTGALSGVLDEASRQKGRQLATDRLGIENKNAMLKEQQRQEGMKGLEGMYGTDVGAQLKEQGLVPEDINAWANAGKTGWLQNATGVLDTLSSGAGAAAGVKKAFG